MSEGDDTPRDAERSPRPLPVALFRPAAVAFASLLALTAGLHGWWYVLSKDTIWYRYTLGSLLGDLLLLFGGALGLFVAAGTAARRVVRDDAGSR